MSHPGTPTILWLEDSKEDVSILSKSLQEAGLEAEITQVETKDEFTTALDSSSWDIILADFDVPGFSPIEAIDGIHSRELDIPLIVVSGAITTTQAVDLMRAGARDFVSKDEIARLAPAIRRECGERENQNDWRRRRRRLEERNAQLADTLQQLRNAQADTIRLHRIRAIGEMATGVAHEFNNALMKISGLLATVKAGLRDQQCFPEQDETLEYFTDAVSDSVAVVKRVASFYATSREMEPDTIDLNLMIKDVVAELAPLWAEQYGSGKIKVDWNHGEISPISSKFAELFGALRNILVNAVEAMPDGGTIAITTSRSPDRRTLLTISDTGQGMTPEVLRRCLEPFYSTKGEFGTGLGLGIADAVVQQYGGILTVDSQVGEGTNVSIVFKSAETNPAERSVYNPLADDLELDHSLHVLIAEDDVVIAKLLARFLAMHGHTSYVTHDGADAIAAFEEQRFDLVLSDRSMPVMKGDEVAAKVNETSPETPFILVTGYGDLMNERGELPYGVDLVISKPTDDITLIEGIRRVFAEKPARVC